MTDLAQPALIHGATALRWLAPAASSLTLLARLPGAAWPTLRQDPGALLLLLRSAKSTEAHLPFPNGLLVDALPIESALRHLEEPGHFTDWHESRVRPIYENCLTLARLTRSLALRSGRADAEQAWCCGLLAPLGWLALATVAPARVAATLIDSAFSRDPLGAPERHLGVDPVVVARRLARQWELPGWLAGIAGHLELPLDHARRFHIDPMLFSLTRLAVQVARQRGVELGLVGPQTDLSREEALTGLTVRDLDAFDLPAEDAPPVAWHDPYQQPLLRDLLALALENRRLGNTPRVARLEGELDSLHAVLGEQVRGESDRLRSAKLLGLAEFAAGASHEINNPLAVISGQAQYILGHEADWLAADRDGLANKALQAIITQAKRIHAILRDLMQFAKPAPPRASWFDLPTLLGEVVASLEEQALQKRLRVEVVARPERLAVLADPEQLRSAVTCLLRNAVEAAPHEGWARLVVTEPGQVDRVEVFVEDSGPGPAVEQRPHLFDPFFSGRSAGRGRGLGLPLAWRLARQQGGDVYLEPPRTGQPTRFVLALPRHASPAGVSAA